MSLQGIVIKAYSSYYYVQQQEKVYTCKLRGRFKKETFSLLVGDNVEFELTGPDKGIIENILPRTSMLRRPTIANVDQVVLTFAACNPDINSLLVDKFLVLAELSKLHAVLCINKVDLADSAEIEKIVNLYESIGYEVVTMAAKHAFNVDKLRRHLYNRISVFAGPSGVGKSTILNAVEPGFSLNTGEVSTKIGRGKHTTRYAQLLALPGGGFVVDTPGFSSTNFDDIDERELASCFPEFTPFTGQCRFNGCLHYKEPQCAIKEAVHEREISQSRYDSYLSILQELRENKRGY